LAIRYRCAIIFTLNVAFWGILNISRAEFAAELEIQKTERQERIAL